MSACQLRVGANSRKQIQLETINIKVFSSTLVPVISMSLEP